MGYDKGNAHRNQLTALHTYNWLKKHHLSDYILSDYIYITLVAAVISFIPLIFINYILTVSNHWYLSSPNWDLTKRVCPEMGKNCPQVCNFNGIMIV